ncbi:MAG: gluconeogenesis factor YvcK family protein [Acidimicrobiales bacterium]
MSGLVAGGPRVVGLGGGHGLAASLAAARRYAGDITAVVSVADDGGSSGRLRRDLGIPAPGDVRRCLVALAADPDGLWARAFGGRFDRGDLAGHSLGNLVIAGLVRTTGSFTAAVEEAGRLLDACGRVLPATVDPVVLTATIDGRRHEGQTAVEASARGIATIGLEPSDAAAPDEVVDAIDQADQIVVGPGSLFTSVIAVAAVPMIKQALARRRGHVVYVCNLKASKETVGYDVGAHVAALARHGVGPDVVLADPAAIDVGSMPEGVRLVEAALARPDGWFHDANLLAAALSGLADWAGE